MMQKRHVLTLFFWWLTGLFLLAQPLCSVTRYDEDDGLPSSHLTQLLQDDTGMMWFATWNGLCRYDGYEFRTFKPQVGDGCHMTTDRLRNIVLLPSRQILCQVDEEYYMFDLTSYRFRDLTNGELGRVEEMMRHRQSRSLQRKPYTWTDSYQTQWTLYGDGRLTYRDSRSGQEVAYPLAVTFNELTFAMADSQGNLWVLDYGSVYKLCTDVRRTQRLAISPQAEVRCLYGDREGRYWVATKGDEVVRVYRTADHQLLGYLGSDGRLHTGYTSFGAPVYSMCQTQNGTLWLGAKQKGLYRLTPDGGQGFRIDHFNDIPHQDIYHLAVDSRGRLWVASLGGGVFMTERPQEAQPVFKAPRNYPKKTCLRARYMLLTRDNILLVATGNGLLVSQMEADVDDMSFLLHQREPERKQSLSCSATMDVVEDRQHRFFVSTESGGVNMIENQQLTDSVLSFRHLRDQYHGQSNDVVRSMALNDDGGLIAVGSHLITLFDSSGQVRVLNDRNLSGNYRFSEAHPLRLSDGRWLFGLTDGAFITTAAQMEQQAFVPPLVWTGISIQGTADQWAMAYADTITLKPAERNVTVHFAALDYSASQHISYAFRLLPYEEWNYQGHAHTATLLDLEPGEYQLQIRATNADGQWTDPVRSLTIIVEPTFWESALGRLLMLLLAAAVMTLVIYTLVYIRRIRRKQHETLELYLALLNKPAVAKESVQPEPSSAQQARTEEDAMLKRIMRYVEENISNSDANVGDMAAAAATSRSGLQRKLRQTMGVTPQDLMHEARIKRACQLLRQSDKNISEVAYACGFTDPKYFSRSFKKRTGLSPTDYKNTS